VGPLFALVGDAAYVTQVKAFNKLTLLLAMVLMISSCNRDSATASKSAATGSGAVVQRVVALTPSATEVVAAIGAVNLLVGVDDYSTFPPQVTGLPKVGSFLSPQLETIIGLRPTLVIVDEAQGTTAGALGDAGVVTISCKVHTIQDVEFAIMKIGDALQRHEQAVAAVQEIAVAKTSAIAFAGKARASTTEASAATVLVIIDRQPGSLGGLVAAGPGSWVDELLRLLGSPNALAASPVRYPKISVEEVLRADPSIILDLSFAKQDEDVNEVWRAVSVRATKSNRVRALSASYLQAPSPRIVEALATLRQALAP
jgi:iron complex transport system substrate-binding protein